MGTERGRYENLGKGQFRYRGYVGTGRSVHPAVG